MNPFKQKRELLAVLKGMKDAASKPPAQENDKVIVCPKCESRHTQAELSKLLYVCPDCGHHYNVTAKYRIRTLLDHHSFREICGTLKGGNPLNFPGYEDKLEEQRRKTGMREAVICGTGRICGIKTVVCFMDNRFMMGSMGTAVGEKITRACEYATKKRLPLIIFATSGGARMQEGILSLFQMAKTSAAVSRHNEKGLLFISVLTHPTTGGVTASFASLGDIILAEPKALIGFAGPRVIEQTIKAKLPEGFQRAEYLQEQGFVDAVVPRGELRERLGVLLKIHEEGKR